MANVNITTIIEVSGHGTVTRGKHGAVTDSIQVPKVISVTGTVHEVLGSLAATTAATIYDADADLPALPDFMYFWADQAYQLQLLTDDTEVTHSGAAEVPTILSQGGALGSIGLLASAVTTNISAVATLAALDEITIFNTAASAMAYHLILVA